MTDTTELRSLVVEEARSWVVYALKDPRDGAVRYVGFTRKGVENRLGRHIYNATREGAPAFDYSVARWIRKLRSAGVNPIIEQIESGTGDWASREQFHIARMSAEGCDLTSVALGGHFMMPPEARRRAGEKLKTRIFTAEHRRRISASKLAAKTKRRDAAMHLRRVAAASKGKRMRLSLEERHRRAAWASGISRRGHWLNKATPERRAEYLAAHAERMRKSWETRLPSQRAFTNG